jgi:hypothetical protein
MASLKTAYTAAFSYALLVLLAGLLLLAGTLSQGEASWRRVAGHSAIAFIAPLPPLATLWLGRKVASSQTTERSLAGGVIVSVLVPIIIGVPAMLSTEPLAMLSLLYTFPIQVAIGLFTLLIVWGAGRSRS